MKKIALLFTLFTCLIGFGQEHSGGIVVPTGFKIAANQPIDDRTVVSDSLSLGDIPNKYAGLITYSINDSIPYFYNGVDWYRLSKADDYQVPTLNQVINSGDDAYVVTDRSIDLLYTGNGDVLSTYHYLTDIGQYDRFLRIGIFNNRLQFFTTQVQENFTSADIAFFGAYSLQDLRRDVASTAIQFNSAFGTNSLRGLTLGVGNTGIGNNVGRYLTEGNNNTFLGRSAGYGVSNNPLTGSSNTFIGALSGYGIGGESSGNTIVGSLRAQDIGEGQLINDEVILAYGGSLNAGGKIAFRKHQDGTTVVPQQTKTTYDNDVTGKAVVTKEILEDVIDDFAKNSELAEVAFSGSYDDLEDKPSIPTKTSDLTNDSGFITSSDLTAENTSFNGTISALEADNVQDAIDEVVTMISEAGGGTVTSVGLTVPTGLQVSGSPITSSGTLAITYESGYQGYTTAEAIKLSGIETGAQVNVNADWNAVSGDAQILNKPTIPTKTSQLENDSGFVTSSGVTSVSGTANQIVSTGGDTPTLSLHSDVIVSLELANTAIQSDDLATVATTGDYNDLDNLPSIPTKTSDLTNDSGFITSSDLPSPQSLNDVLSVGSVATGKTITITETGFGHNATIGDYTFSSNNGATPTTFARFNWADGFSFGHNGYTARINRPGNLTNNSVHQLQDKSGTLGHLEDIENHSPKVYSVEITLSKTDINNLHTTPIVISSIDLGLESGQGAKFLRERTEVRIFTDGTDFSSTRPIQIGNGDLIDIMDLSHLIYTAPSPDGVYAGSGSASFLTYKVKDEYYITTSDEIKGGGTDCYIKFRLFYNKIDL